MNSVIVRPALRDAGDVRRVVARYADFGYDLVLRAGCPPDQASSVLLSALQRVAGAPADGPAGIGDLLGDWLRAAQGLADQAARSAGPEPSMHPAGDADEIACRVRLALEALEPDSARLLLLRDSYDLPPGPVAVAIGVEIPELHRRIAAARLAFLRRYDPPATKLLLELPPCAADPGELAALCDSTAPPGVDANLRRHAYRCQRCEETAEVQRRARRILSWVRPRSMEPSARAALVVRAGRLGSGRLVTLEALLDAGSDEGPRRISHPRRRRPARGLVAATLSAALVSGVAVGLTDLGRPGRQPADSSQQQRRSDPPNDVTPTVRSPR